MGKLINGLSFNAGAPSLRKQLSKLKVGPKAGTTYYPGGADIWQRQADSISLLVLHGLILGSEAYRARRRLLKKISNWYKDIGIKGMTLGQHMDGIRGR